MQAIQDVEQSLKEQTDACRQGKEHCHTTMDQLCALLGRPAIPCVNVAMDQSTEATLLDSTSNRGSASFGTSHAFGKVVPSAPVVAQDMVSNPGLSDHWTTTTPVAGPLYQPHRGAPQKERQSKTQKTTKKMAPPTTSMKKAPPTTTFKNAPPLPSHKQGSLSRMFTKMNKADGVKNIETEMNTNPSVPVVVPVLAETRPAVLAESRPAVLAETGMNVLLETGMAVLAKSRPAVLSVRDTKRKYTESFSDNDESTPSTIARGLAIEDAIEVDSSSDDEVLICNPKKESGRNTKP